VKIDWLDLLDELITLERETMVDADDVTYKKKLKAVNKLDKVAQHLRAIVEMRGKSSVQEK
jgi:hypothetical protein